MYLVNAVLNVLLAISFVWFYRSYKDVLSKNEDKEKDTKAETDPRTMKEVYFVVLKKKKVYLALNFALFYTLFLVFPNFMFSMQGDGATLLLIFGISECCSRAINAAEFKFLLKIINGRNVYIYCAIQYSLCFLPFINYLAYKKILGEAAYNAFYPVITGLNIAYYFLIAFGLGIVGNTLGICMFDGFTKSKEFSVAGTLYSICIVLPILLGSATATLISILIK